MRQLLLVMPWVGLALGCDTSPTELLTTDVIRDETAPIQTGSLLYLLDRTETRGTNGRILEGIRTSIDYAYTNPTDQTIYVAKCLLIGFRLDRRGDTGKWVEFWNGPDYTRCLGEPTVVSSGGTLGGTLEVFGFEPNVPGIPRFPVSDISGVYRMVLLGALYLDDPSEYPDGVLVESEHLSSNQFELRFR